MKHSEDSSFSVSHKTTLKVKTKLGTVTWHIPKCEGSKQKFTQEEKLMMSVGNNS